MLAKLITFAASASRNHGDSHTMIFSVYVAAAAGFCMSSAPRLPSTRRTAAVRMEQSLEDFLTTQAGVSSKFLPQVRNSRKEKPS